MANLFNRIFLDEKKELFGLSDVNKNIVSGGKAEAAAATAAIAELPLKVQVSNPIPPKGGEPKGGASKEERLEYDHMEYFQRWNVFLLIFLVSIFLAILTMKNKVFITKILKQKKVEDLSTLDNKWIKITRFTIVFIALILAYNIALIFGVYLYFGLGNMFLDDKGKIPAKTKFFELFWKYENEVHDQVFIGKDYAIALIIVLFIVFIAYMGFSKWYPDWLDSIYFQTIDKPNNKKDDTQPQKYIHYYAIFIILMMFFYLLVLDVGMLTNNKLYMAYNFIFLIAYMILALIIFKEYKFGHLKKLAFVAIMIALMFLLYPVLLSLIQSKKNKNDIFNSEFFKNLILQFSIKFKGQP